METSKENAALYVQNLKLLEEARLKALAEKEIETNKNILVTEQIELFDLDNSSKLYYDLDGNLIKKELYKDSTLTILLQTKNFIYDINGNLTDILTT